MSHRCTIEELVAIDREARRNERKKIRAKIELNWTPKSKLIDILAWIDAEEEGDS